MNRRIGIAVTIGALVAAFALWRCRSESDPSAAGSAELTGSATGVAARKKPLPDPKTLARGSISGTVTEEGKTPIAHARVCADGSAENLSSDLFHDSPCAETDAQGKYAIANLLPATYVVSATAKTYRPSAYHAPSDLDKRDFKLAAGETRTNIDIALRRGGVELVGTVSDLTGGPIAHAHVAAGSGWWRRGNVTAHGETDEQGKFTLWVRPGDTYVRASAEGYADTGTMTYAPGKVELLLTPESSFAGTVVEAESGRPVEGARVMVGTSTEWGWENGRTVLSDAQGKFRIARLTPGRYVAVARTENGYGRTEGSLLVGLGQHVDGATVKLFPARKIEGKVIVASTKQPCAEPSVTLRESTRNAWLRARRDDESGTLVVDGVQPGTYSVDAECEGFQARDKYDAVVVADKDITGLVWEVDAGATIRGKVLGKSGEPVEDASVWAETSGGDARAKQRWAEATSRGDGSYQLTGIAAGSFKLEVSTDKGIAPRDGFKVDVTAGATIEKDLVLEDGGTIKGKIVDGEGVPVAGVDVRAWPINDQYTFMFNDRGHKSDENGAFAIDSLRAGDYRVVAQRGWRDELRKPGTNDDAKQGERVTVRVNQTASVTLVVESQTGVIKGSVVDAEGKAVSDAFVSAARESDAAGARRSSVQETRSWWDEKPVLTGTDGAFALTKLSPGTYTVRAYRKGGGEAIAEHVAVGSTAKLQIKATGTIEGTAKRSGAPSGSSIDELAIQVRDITTGFMRRETYYKTGGHFIVRDLPKGHFAITASSGASQKQVEVDLAEGESKTVAIELEALLDITGRIVERGTGKPIAGMMMFAQPVQASIQFTFSMDDDRDNISDEAGRFTVKRVPHGRILVRGFARNWDDSEYNGPSAIKTAEGSGTVDVGDIEVMRKRVKKGDPVGELGIHWEQLGRDTPPDKREWKISFIDPTGPAAKTELKVGDIVTTVDGVEIGGANADQGWQMMRAPPGTKLVLGTARGTTATITLAAP